MNTNESKQILQENETPSLHRVRVFNENVTFTNKKFPKEYSQLMHRLAFDDHRRLLIMDNKVIGFIVSPYNINYERHKALELEGHKVLEMRQYYHKNAETLAVIKEEYLSGHNICWFWKLFKLRELSKADFTTFPITLKLHKL